ncbi:MAG TPA: hypothetical protein ENK65_00845 [Helicobacteraceae bacterium]|nr:hypothetical protein [Helicobacteraceae bacterium]
MPKTLSLSLLITLILFTGCAQKSEFMQQDILQGQGMYRDAVVQADKSMDHDDFEANNNLLWNLNLGYAYYMLQNDENSTRTFNDAERLMKIHREQILASDISQTLSSILVNDNTRPYIGKEYDGIMINTYKALNYLDKQDFDGARVEFNRAIDRQRRAKEFFSKSIEKQSKAIAQEEANQRQKGGSMNVDRSLDNTDAVLNRSYPELNAYKTYPQFINPLTNYLAGLFALYNGDVSKGEFLLKEAKAMMPDSKAVQEDYKTAEAIYSNHQRSQESLVWVIFENGQAPLLKEMRVDFPAWIFSNRLAYVSLALPKLQPRQKAFDYIDINGQESHFLCSMERVIQTEFKNEYPSIVGRALLSAMTKTAIQYQANQQNEWAGLAAAIYQIASTSADTRIWSALPKEVQIVRMQRPENGQLILKQPNNTIIKEISLPDTQQTLVYVRIPTNTAKASIRVMPLGEQ